MNQLSAVDAIEHDVQKEDVWPLGVNCCHSLLCRGKSVECDATMPLTEFLNDQQGNRLVIDCNCV